MTQIGQHIGKRLFEEVKKHKQYSGNMALKAAIEEISLQGSYCSDFQNLQVGFAFRLLH
jgi:hypothetical protein